MSEQKVYMPLMVGDWLKGTRGMKAEVRGVYLSLLLYQWDNGFIPSDWEELCLIDPELPKVWDKIKSKFVELEPGKLFNKKNTEVKEFWKKQKTNGEKGGRPKKKTQNETQTITQQQTQTQTFNNDLDLANDLELEKQKGVSPPVTPEVTQVPRGTVDAMIEKVCKYFSVTCDVMSPLYDSVCDFVETVASRGEMLALTTSLDKYQAYKARSQETIHGVGTWIGTKDKHYRDGQWIMTNWEEKDKNYKQPTKENVRSANQRNTESISARPEGFGSFG